MFYTIWEEKKKEVIQVDNIMENELPQDFSGVHYVVAEICFAHSLIKIILYISLSFSLIINEKS